MPDTPFKAMGREPSERRLPAWLERGKWSASITVTACERCGGSVFTGDWPWCRGTPSDHERE